MSGAELSAAVAGTLAAGGDRLAISFGDEDFSWKWIAEFAAKLDCILASASSPDNARVALVARNRPAHIAAIAANIAAHRATCMIHSAQPPARIAADIQSLSPIAVIADEQDWTRETVQAAASCAALGIVLTRDHDEPVRRHPALATPEARPRAPVDAEVGFEMLTSGTTGAPKRAPLRWDTVAAATADAHRAYAGSEDAGPLLMIHPLGNIAGISYLAPPLALGRSIVLLERFEVSTWVAAVERHGVRRASLPAAALRMILNAGVPRDALASLKVVVVGGSRVEPEQRDAFEACYGVPVLLAYGATEFAGVVANWTLDLYREYGPAKRESVGKPCAGVAFRIVDPETDGIIGGEQVGVIEAKVDRLGPGWIRTTDLGRLDPDGFLYLHGRADGAINRGGFKIVPEVVAAALREHPSVADAAVVALPDDRLGEVPGAAVELAEGAPGVDGASLIDFARQRLLAYQVPVKVLVVPRLPRTSALKVALGEVRELLQTDSLVARVSRNQLGSAAVPSGC